MNFKSTNKGFAISVAGMLLAAAVPVFAHNGVEHIGGTVSKVSAKVLTLKTPGGEVEVKLGDKTAITKNGQKAQLSDLTPGIRVQADVPEEGEDKTARAVKIGAAAAPPHDMHDMKDMKDMPAHN